MPFLKNKKGKEPVRIFYQDYGTGKPVILIHSAIRVGKGKYGSWWRQDTG
jgi:hypothetical protein